MKKFFVIGITLGFLFFSAGCGEVTYPKESLREAIIKLCDEEYGVDIDVSIVGDTLAIYLPLPHLFDITLALSEEAQEKIQDVLLGASRVVLSTDAEIKFYCVITQDIRLPEIQLVIIKYIDDIKRVFYNDISRGEYFKRTLIDMNENPQAKKEKTIMDVFEKMGLDKELQDKVLDDFFRAEPSSLESIGYWNGKFYVKNITLEEFLAQQMASRIKLRFSEEKTLNKYALKMISGKYAAKKKARFFLINFKAEPFLFIIEPAANISMEREIFENAFKEITDVIYGYKFNEFDLVRIMEDNTQRALSVSREDVYLFKQNKLGIGSILRAVN